MIKIRPGVFPMLSLGLQALGPVPPASFEDIGFIMEDILNPWFFVKDIKEDVAFSRCRK